MPRNQQRNPFLWNASRCLLIATIALVFTSGCGLSRPNWFEPGHLYHQRLRATHFDPYANTDVAPDFEGGRPRSYEVPRSAPEKAQWFMDIPYQQ